MAKQEPDRGPKFVWNFPLIRRLQSPNGLLSLGTEIIRNRQEDKNKGEDMEQDFSTTSSDVNEVSSGSNLDDLEDEIGSLEADSGSVFSSSEDGEVVVTVTDNGFEPQDVSIDTGDTVKWVNESSTDLTIISTNNTRLSSGNLEPGDEYTETLYTNVKIEYQNEDGDYKGTVTVGSPENTSDDIERVPFNSMTQVADEKEQTDRGFDQ